ncbi:hypothetical protein KSS87_022177 [Heliosperma pusillum]|nr:hypothetical protein KSS87_022177 [Heliosperma pusillum]
MNRGGRGNSSGGKSQGSWRPKHPHSSPNYRTPVRYDASPGGSVSSASVEKSYSSGQGAENNSGGGMYRNVTPPTHQGRGWATFGSGSSSSEGNVGESTPFSNAVEKNSGVKKLNSSGHAVEKNSGGGMYRNVTPPIRQGGGWSKFGSGSSSSEGIVGKTTPSSNAVEKNSGVEKSNSSGHVVEKNSGGGMYRNVTPPTHPGGGWSKFGSGSSSGEGNVEKSTPSSNAVENNSKVEKSNSSGHVVEKNSGGGMYRNVTPPIRPREGWSKFGSGSSSGEGNVEKSPLSSNAVENNSRVEKSNSSGHAVKNYSGSGMYRNVTPATCPGLEWSTFGSGSSSGGGNVGQSALSSNASSSASGFRRDERIGLGSGQLNSSGTAKALSKGDIDRSSVNLDRAFIDSLVQPPEAAQLSEESVPLKSCSDVKIPESTDSLGETENSECPIEKFDLCPPRKSRGVELKQSLMSQNRERRKEKTRLSSGLQGDILRPGMVLLKHYLSIAEQASILKICRDNGLVNVGFYQPQFGEGGKMNLKLMCFGQFWNPETNHYEEVRPTDHSKPPPIPQKLLELVDRAVRDSQSLIRERERVKNVESILPSVKPDICLDKDESQESLRKGIPIVSFSIGDSAEFLYNDQRDAENAAKVELESGDVLIFGGKSRHIFHGVPAIKSGTAPKMLLEETNFRSGRLNLTFRQRR